MNLPSIAPFSEDSNPDPRPNRRAIRLHPDQPHRQPPVAIPRVHVQRVEKAVAGVEPANLHEDVLVAVPVNIPERYPMSLLDMPKTRRECDIRERLAAIVPIRHIRRECVERRKSGSEVDVMESRRCPYPRSSRPSPGSPCPAQPRSVTSSKPPVAVILCKVADAPRC